MLNPFKRLQLIKAEMFMSMPGNLWFVDILMAKLPGAGKKMFVRQ